MTSTPRRYRALVLDLDGTLIDSAPALQAIAGRYLGGLGLPPLTLDEARSFIGDGARVFCRRMLESRGVPVDGPALDRHYHDFHEVYVDGPADENVVYDGAHDTLAAIAARGIRLGLCTNKPEMPTRKVLDAFGLAPLFGAVVTGDTLPQKKPDPAPLLHTIAALDVRPEEALFVGDSEVDAATAAAAGVDFALHERGYLRDATGVNPAMRFATWADFGAAV